ncbi:ANTAR domain-containing protein [Streptomyces sp. JJ36]|uniref:ANTAR domain-containing protein n=1 Tax=Streptomyces sp. JJ36 TaxID=2736645 RepID=UPI001F34B2A6|nr:ANTAR domain-containing protein [Streptomyces sp. JJ36]MCF6525394.1 ANTAR domain-containing protein [Streptomyces sp. JJ36]
MPQFDLENDAVFTASSTPSVVLDRRLVIRSANPAYLEATGRSWDELRGRHVFSAFPGNPHHPEADGVARMDASFRRVRRLRRPHHLPVQRYDIPWRDAPTGFLERHWTVVNSPVLDADGELVGILLQPRDITAFRTHIVKVLEEFGAANDASGPAPALDEGRLACAAAVVLAGAREQQEVKREQDGLKEENQQLKNALDTRPAIDQAIGIVLTEESGTPEEAFQRLVRLSQETNVKLRDIARALVARAAAPDRPLLP